MEPPALYLPQPVRGRPQGDDLPVVEIRLRDGKYLGLYHPIPGYYGVFIEVANDHLPAAVELWTRADERGTEKILRALLDGRRSPGGRWVQQPMAPHVTPDFVRALADMIETAFRALPDGIPAPMAVES